MWTKIYKIGNFIFKNLEFFINIWKINYYLLALKKISKWIIKQ